MRSDATQRGVNAEAELLEADSGEAADSDSDADEGDDHGGGDGDVVFEGGATDSRRSRCDKDYPLINWPRPPRARHLDSLMFRTHTVRLREKESPEGCSSQRC